MTGATVQLLLWVLGGALAAAALYLGFYTVYEKYLR